MRSPLSAVVRSALFASSVLLLAAAGPTTAPTGAPTSRPTTAATAINWDQAAKHVGETATVTGPVKGTHAAGKNVVLNVGKDFPAADRFTIYLPFDAAGGTADAQYVGKTVTVTGKIELYKKVPEIKAAKASDVTVK